MSEIDRAAPATPPRTPTPVRRDIQGLRAIAVLAVIANHLLGWPAGGFVGVDIFFVISGFLITGLLLRDYEQTGSISLRGFYARRIRRIVPTALAVLLATLAAGYFLFNTARLASTLWDAIFAGLFAANWRFVAVGTDYFQSDTATSPLQHFWSLAVEEQFYLLWPGLLVLALLLVSKLGKSRTPTRAVTATLLAVIAAASFLYAMTETATSPTVAYFSSFARAWELGVGALLAVAAPLFSKVPFAARFVAGWVGLLLLGASFFVIDSSVAFPGPGAALPVLATAVVIAAGIGGQQRYLFVLHNPVSVYLGNISYSLYLWHFPVIIFFLVLMPRQTLGVTLFIGGMILAISITAFHLIEQPFHRSPLFAPYRGDGEQRREARRDAWQTWRDKFSAGFMLSLVSIAAMVIVVALAVNPILKSGGDLIGQASTVTADEDAVGTLQAELSAALATTAWPTNLSPSLDDAIRTTSQDNSTRGCFDIGDTASFERCTWGSASAPNHAYLVGDSIALSYGPAFKEIAESSNGQWRITTIGLYGCRFTAVTVMNEGAGVMDACETRKNDIAAEISSHDAQLVIVANAFTLGQTPDGTSLGVSRLVASAAEEAAGYNKAGRILYLAPPPVGAELGQCYSKVSSPQGCTVTVSDEWQRFATATTESASASGDKFLSSLPFNCVDTSCPAFGGTVPTKYDTVHLTDEWSKHIAPAILKSLVAFGVM